MLNFSNFKCGRIYLRYSDANELTLKKPKLRITESLNSTAPNEVAHTESPHLDLHCLPSIVFDFLIAIAHGQNNY